MGSDRLNNEGFGAQPVALTLIHYGAVRLFGLIFRAWAQLLAPVLVPYSASRLIGSWRP